MNKLLGFWLGNNDKELHIRYSGFIRFVPLVLSGGFFLVTILLHAFGPTDWKITNPGKLYPFLLLCAVSLSGGYTLAVFKGKTASRRMELNNGRILTVGALVFLALFFPLCYVTTGKWFPDVYLGITNTGAAYQLAKYYSATGPKFFFYLRILLSPFIFIVMPMTLFFFPKLTRPQKVLGISVIVLNVALGVAQGVNKHVADICMQLVLVLAILLFSAGKRTRKENAVYCFKLVTLILVICVSFVLYYSNTMSNRIATDIVTQQKPGVSTPTDNDSQGGNAEKPGHSEGMKPEDIFLQQPQVDQQTIQNAMNGYANFSVGEARESAFWDAVIPERLKPIINYMISYFCHGYNGLSYAMDQEFTSSFGLGFSDFIRHNFARFFGGADLEEAVYQRTYMAKLEKLGWKTGLMWSSFFIYPASDISFLGTVVLVFLIGYLFGLSWKDTVETQNPFACAAFFGFTTMVFYFSANNQMFQSGESCVAFCVILAAWIASRFIIKRREKQK